MQEGWNFGFDEGFKTGIRKVFRDSRDAGIDLSSLELMEYISREDKIKGLMKNLYKQLTKVFAISDRLDSSIKLHEKFSSYSDKRKKLAVKVGKKNIVKMITQFFKARINSNSSHQLMIEFLFDECIKKYGNSKLADKKLVQIFAGGVYHQKSERVSIFCSSIHLSDKRNFSNDILNLYLYMLKKFQKEYNTRINAIKDEVNDGDNEFGPFFKAVDIFKELFEEKIPAQIYTKLKQQVEKMMISKSTMKIIDVDKFCSFVINNYMKHYINFNSPSEIIYNAWTLYERHSITMNELYVTTELIKPVSIMVDIVEDGKQTTISKDQFYALFTEHLKGKPNENIYSHQYKEVMDNVDTFSARRVKKIFDLTPYKNSTNDFKQDLQEILPVIKDKINELYKGKKWKKINRLDDKSFWLQRLHGIQRAIGTVNTTLLNISLILLQQSLDFYLTQKRTLLVGREDEDEGEDNQEGSGEENEISESLPPKVPKTKGSSNYLSRNDSKIPNETSVDKVSGDQKSSIASHPKLNPTSSNSNKKSNAPRKDSIIVNNNSSTPSGKVSTANELSKAKPKKSFSTQKTLFSGSAFKSIKKVSKFQ